MPKRLQKPSKSEAFPHWIGGLEGYCNSTVLARGSRYIPSSEAELALVAAPPDAARVFDDSVVSADIVPIVSDGDRKRCRAESALYATRNLLLIELDMNAFQSLIAESQTFRDLFQKAAATRLRHLHDRCVTPDSGTMAREFAADTLLSDRPVAPLQ